MTPWPLSTGARVAWSLAALAAGLALSLDLRAADDLDAFVEAQMALRQVNGLSLAVIQHGRIETARAYGVTSRETPAPISTTTLFQAGSISKPVAAVGALRLVEQGKIALDEDVNVRLTTWKVPESSFTSTARVTVRRLLSHTAGLTVHGFPGYAIDARVPTLVQVLDGAGNTAPIRVDVVPGSLWRYSGGGYTVMQQLVIDVTGQRFPQYMQEAVLGPAGMRSSTFDQPLSADRAAQTASGYHANRSAVAGRWHVYPEMAAAGLWTTPSDLARFAIAIQQSATGKSNTLLSQAMTRQLLTVEKGGMGLGLALSGQGATRRFGHNGRDAGFDALMQAYAETGQGVVLMINANDNSSFKNGIVQFIARKYQWPEYPLATPAAARPTVRTVSVGPLADVNGLPDEKFVNGKERSVPRIGPLFDDLTPQRDPDPALTESVAATLRALAQGGAAADALRLLTAGGRANLTGAASRPFASLRALIFLHDQDVTGRGIERLGSGVARVLFYRMDTDRGSRRVMIHLTSDKLITDFDVVDR